MRRMVFLYCLLPKAPPELLVFILTKLRRTFYAQIERASFRTASVEFPPAIATMLTTASAHLRRCRAFERASSNRAIAAAQPRRQEPLFMPLSRPFLSRLRSIGSTGKRPFGRWMAPHCKVLGNCRPSRGEKCDRHRNLFLAKLPVRPGAGRRVSRWLPIAYRARHIGEDC